MSRIMYMVQLKPGYTATPQSGGVMSRICGPSDVLVSVERYHMTIHHTPEEAERCRRRHCVATAAALEVVPVALSYLTEVE